MNYKQTVDYIYSLKGSEHKGNFNLSLENMRVLLRKLNDPEKSLRVIHVAGTNGKGSVCAMISSILKEAGYRVGTYTSPHLKDFRERFLINNKKISKEDLVKYFKNVRKYLTNQTFFEFITSMAFLYFKDKKVDFLVCEVGLGGRLDATNVVNPLVSVITNIGLEHKEYLGGTIEKIAYEKAGIIKKGIPAVTGAKGPALNVIKKIAKKNNSRLYTNGKPINVSLRLRGEFQLVNASVASKAIKVLRTHHNIKISDNIIKRGLLKTTIHGRLEFTSKNILFDCAHNLDAIKALKKELLKIRYNKLYLVIGILKNKDYKNMLKQLVPLTDITILVKPKIPRALDPKILAESINKNYIIIEDTKKAMKYAKEIAKKEDLILVTGSFYVVGEVI